MGELTVPTPITDRDTLIEQHRSYVRALAVRIMQSLAFSVDLEELINYGNLGLVEAAERFDPLRGVSFSTFSHYRIKGAIYDGLRDMGHYTRADINARARWAANANDLLQSSSDDEYSATDSPVVSVDDEISKVESLIDELIPTYLLSLSSDEVPDIEDNNALSTEEIEQREMIGLVMDLVTELSEDEQELINALYFKHVSMTHLAAQMGITKSWISRLHARAIKHLRDKLKEKGILTGSSELQRAEKKLDLIEQNTKHF